MSETNKSIVQDCHIFEEAFHNAQGDGFENRHPQFQHGFYEGFKAAWQAKQGVGEWQPIETAPRDGSEMVMLWDSHYRNPIIGYWNGRAGAFGWCRDTYGVMPCKGGDLRSFIDQDDITHWQSLPQPPREQS